MPLNEAQARTIAVTLQILEERCDQMRQVINKGARDGALHRVLDDIPPDARAALLHQITTIEAAIARLAAVFDLSVPPRSARRVLAGLLASSWENLEDTRPAKLGRYGPLDPQIVAPLEAELGGLIATITIMRAEMQPESAARRSLDVAH